MAAEVTDNSAHHRFELEVEGTTALIAYRPAGQGVLELVHTEVPEALSGQGVGSRLVKGTLELLRARGVKVVPSCSFVAAYIRRHPEYQGMVAG